MSWHLPQKIIRVVKTFLYFKNYHEYFVKNRFEKKSLPKVGHFEKRVKKESGHYKKMSHLEKWLLQKMSH